MLGYGLSMQSDEAEAHTAKVNHRTFVVDWRRKEINEAGRRHWFRLVCSKFAFTVSCEYRCGSDTDVGMQQLFCIFVVFCVLKLCLDWTSLSQNLWDLKKKKFSLIYQTLTWLL